MKTLGLSIAVFAIFLAPASAASITANAQADAPNGTPQGCVDQTGLLRSATAASGSAACSGTEHTTTVTTHSSSNSTFQYHFALDPAGVTRMLMSGEADAAAVANGTPADVSGGASGSQSFSDVLADSYSILAGQELIFDWTMDSTEHESFPGGGESVGADLSLLINGTTAGSCSVSHSGACQATWTSTINAKVVIGLSGGSLATATAGTTPSIPSSDAEASINFAIVSDVELVDTLTGNKQPLVFVGKSGATYSALSAPFSLVPEPSGAVLICLGIALLSVARILRARKCCSIPTR